MLYLKHVLSSMISIKLLRFEKQIMTILRYSGIFFSILSRTQSDVGYAR